MSRRRKSIGRINGLQGGSAGSPVDAASLSYSEEYKPRLESSPRQTAMKKRSQTQRRLLPAVVSPPAAGNSKPTGGYPQSGSSNTQTPHANGTFSLTASQEELSGIMDKDERQVLRRKRNMIASHLELDKDCIRHLLNTKVINDTILIHIKTESNNYNKVTKMLEVLPIHGSVGVFQRLCSSLETQMPWLAFELRAEMKMEKHELKVEKYVEHEAGLMVRRTFGGSRRLSQMEKDDIHHLVALRTQYAKEVWQMLLNRTRDDLKKEKSTNSLREKNIRGLLQSVSDYLKLQSSRLHTDTKVVGKEEVAPTITYEGEALTEALSDRLGELESLATRALLDREALASERRRAMAVLTAAGADAAIDPQLFANMDVDSYTTCTPQEMSDLARPLMSFSSKIREALEKANADLIECKEDLRQRDNKIISLESELASLRMSSATQLQCRDKTISILTGELRECEDRLRDAKSSSDEFQRRVILTKLEVAKYRTKADALEKTRRLGYAADKPFSNGAPLNGFSANRSMTSGGGGGGGNVNTTSVTSTGPPTHAPGSNTPATLTRRKRSAKKK